MVKMTDREKINFLRVYVTGIGHTDGTSFEEASVTFHGIRPNSLNIISMEEIYGLIDFYNKLSIMEGMGHVVTAPERFVYWFLKDHGLIDAFSKLADYQAGIPLETEGDDEF